MKVTTIGLDLAKNVFQVHGITDDGDVVFNPALRLFPVSATGPPGRSATHYGHAWLVVWSHPKPLGQMRETYQFLRHKHVHSGNRRCVIDTGQERGRPVAQKPSSGCA